MNQIMRASRLGLILVAACSAAHWLPARLFPQEVANTNNQQTAPAVSSSDFQVKLSTTKGVLVRRKGTEEWLEVSQLRDPIVVGLLDGDHRIYVVTKAIKPPKVKHMEEPEYPGGGRMLSGKCEVWLHMVVDDQGVVRQPAVDVSPNPEFAKAALAALNKWRFEPAKLDKQPVAVLMRLEIQFGFETAR